MSLKTRRILFIFFILSFLTITPLIIFYAAGYKLTPGKMVFQKTGTLILDTEPAGAKIYLNGEPELKFLKKYFNEEESFIKTPAKIKGLLPGEYNIKLEKEGYFTWEKKLEIKSGISAYAENVILFKKGLPVSLINGREQKFFISPDYEFLAMLGDKKIISINLRTGEINELKNIETDADDILWSPDSKKIIAGGRVYGINGFNEELNLKNFIGKSASEAVWSGSGSLKIFYPALNRSGINIFDLTEKKSTAVLNADNISAFAIKNGDIYFISQIGKIASLTIAESVSGRVKAGFELPAASDYEFINIENKYINLYDLKRQSLYLIDPFSRFSVVETINNVKYAVWVGKNKILYANDFEIWLADIGLNGQTGKILLTRLSEKINKALWHPSKNYIIYSTDNLIYALELDDREKRNTTELINLNKISSLFLSKDGKTLYFHAKIGNQEGIYKLAIQ